MQWSFQIPRCLHENHKKWQEEEFNRAWQKEILHEKEGSDGKEGRWENVAIEWIKEKSRKGSVESQERMKGRKCALPCLSAFQADQCIRWMFPSQHQHKLQRFVLQLTSIRTKQNPCPHKPQSFLYEHRHIPPPERQPRHNTGWVSASENTRFPKWVTEQKCLWRGSSITALF